MKSAKGKDRSVKVPGFRTIFFLFAWLCLTSPCTALGDIYKCIEPDGVNFTNTPTSNRNCTFYLKENSGDEVLARTRRFKAGPDVYNDIISRAASAFGVDHALIKAVIHAESCFDPNAVSTQGARGLMQIMPQNDASLNISNPFDPSQNIMGGTRYLKRMLTRYNEKLALALAAYNAGPSAVDKYNNIPPYEETQTYVERVKSLYLRYKSS
ncbi:MAG: Soluble lytic murein transglycosylase-like protein [Thermodesulfobacteriota bacterium]|nr:Soluble lytic murein transglycosylase-like protein [Thermodesulfobacteriota bacterium]